MQYKKVVAECNNPKTKRKLYNKETIVMHTHQDFHWNSKMTVFKKGLLFPS